MFHLFLYYVFAALEKVVIELGDSRRLPRGESRRWAIGMLNYGKIVVEQKGKSSLNEDKSSLNNPLVERGGNQLERGKVIFE
jgi:hypothetical protein